MREAIHRTVWHSISVAAGESIHAPTFGFTAAARKSPRIPIGAGGAVMYPKKRGCPLRSECANTNSAVCSSSGAGSIPNSGSGPLRSSASRTDEGDSSWFTGPWGIDSRNAATWSTRRCPSLRNMALSISSGACRRGSLSMTDSLFDDTALRTDSFQQIRLPVASPVYGTENPIKGLLSPQRFVIFRRQGLQRLIGYNLRLVARNCSPHCRPELPRIDHAGDLPVRPR